jgi:hypothetical protein
MPGASAGPPRIEIAPNAGAAAGGHERGIGLQKYADVDAPICCNATTHRAFRYQIHVDCTGLYGGTGGSPWPKNYSTATRRGDVFEIIGGYEEDGKHDRRSCSPVFDKDIHPPHQREQARPTATRRGGTAHRAPPGR